MKRTLVFVLALTLFAPACATNPATGQTEFNIVSEEQELAMGKETHEEILAEYGVYDEKPELNAMIDRIGRRIAATSPRPHLPWSFTLLDTPMVNAMAVPGGYVYVTRGILERMNSEDELAGVIGHEVAHVAARHTAKSISNATLAQAGLVTAAVIAGEENTEKYGGLVMLGAGLLFTKYSRGQETQADLLGTNYMARSGYNPHGSENMLQALLRLQGGSVAGIERYFMDHPDPQKRVNDVRSEIAKLSATDATLTQRQMDRNAFVRMLDGVVTGNSTMETTLSDGVVYNRTYGLVARPPRGWKAVAESGSLFAFYPDSEDAPEEVIYGQELTAEEIEEHGNALRAVRAQLEEMGFERTNSDSGIDTWSGESEGTTYRMRSAVKRVDDAAVVLLHLTTGSNRSDVIEDALEYIDVDPARVAKVRPPRMRVVTSKRGDTWQSLVKRASGDADDAAELAHLNGFDFPSEVPVGMLIKLPEEFGKDQ